MKQNLGNMHTGVKLTLLSAALGATVACQSVAAPAFFGDPGLWSDIAKGEGTVSIVVADGSFADKPPNDVPAAIAVFDRARRQGQLVLGYVSTQSGQRPQADTEANIQRWYSRYGNHLDGIFLDEGPQYDDTTQPYYTAVHQHIKSAYSSFQPKVMLNAPLFPNEWVMNVADYVMLWEETAERYLDQKYWTAQCSPTHTCPPPDWWLNKKYKCRMVHVVHTAS